MPLNPLLIWRYKEGNHSKIPTIIHYEMEEISKTYGTRLSRHSTRWVQMMAHKIPPPPFPSLYLSHDLSDTIHDTKA